MTLPLDYYALPARPRTIADSLGDSLAEQSDAAMARFGGPIKEPGPIEHFGMFLKSALSAGFKEMVGFDPEQDTERWREEHPGWGITSEIAGSLPMFSIPFVGQSALGLKAMQLTRLGSRAVRAADKIDSAPLKFGILEILRWTPFELGRLGAATVGMPFGAHPGRVAEAAAIELPLAGLFGAGIGKLRSIRGAPIPEGARLEGTPLGAGEIRLQRQAKIPGYNLAGTPQDKMQRLIAFRNTKDGVTYQDDIDRVYNHYKNYINTERAPGNTGHVTRVIGKNGVDEHAKRATDRINSVFGRTGLVTSKVLSTDTRKFGDQAYLALEELEAVEAKLAQWWPQEYEAFTQFPRELVFRTGGRKHLDKMLTEDFTSVLRKKGHQVWFTREQGEEALYVGVSRHRNAPKEPWTYFAFKTNDPQRFAPGANKLRQQSVENFLKTTAGSFPGLPHNRAEAIVLAENMSRKGMRLRSGGEFNLHHGKVDLTRAQLAVKQESEEFLSTILSRTNPNKEMTPILWNVKTKVDLMGGSGIEVGMSEKTRAAFAKKYPGVEFPTERIVAGKQPLIIHPKSGKVMPSGGAEDRHLWARYFDDWMPKDWGIARREAKEMMADMGFVAKRAFAPLSAEFTRSPRAVGIMQIVKDSFDDANAVAVETLFGTPVLKESLLKRLITVKGIDRTPGLLSHVETAFKEPTQQQQFWTAWLRGMTPKAALDEGYADDVLRALREIDIVDSKMINQIQLTADALGTWSTFRPTKAHYLISRSWVGGFRVPLKAEGTETIVGFGSGTTSRGALEEAGLIVGRINKLADEAGEEAVMRLDDLPRHADGKINFGLARNEGRVRDIAGETRSDARELAKSMLQQDLVMNAKDIRLGHPLVDRILRTRADILLEDPMRWHKRMGRIGFLGEAKPLTYKDARDRIIANVIESHRLVTRDATWHLLQPQMRQLMREDAAVGEGVIKRWNSMLGVQGEVARAIDKNLDKVLSPFFGPQSGTRFVRMVNEAMYFLTLGAFDAGFVAVNAMTPIQTVFPELSFVFKTPVQRLQKYYTTLAIQTPEGMKAAHFLDPLKFMKRGFEDLASNDPEVLELVKRALDAKIISRQFIEEVVGKDSRVARELFKGKLWAPEEGVFRNFLNAVQAPVAISEEFSRGYSFLVGHRVAKEFFGQTGEKAFSFARKFAERTNYDYATSGRPRVITGALGTGWGLFKNWTMNYLTNLGAYSAEAARGNFGPLLWASMGTGTVGGAVAVPMWGAANGLAEIFSDKDLEEWTYDWIGNGPFAEDRPWAADLLLYGAPSLLEVSVQGRAAAPASAILRDTTMMANTVHIDRFGAVVDTLKDSWDLARRGINPVTSEVVRRDLIRAFAPRTLQRLYAATAEEGLQSLRTGNRIMPSPGAFDRTLYALGITPLDIEKNMDAVNESYEDVAKLRAKIAFYGDLMMQARLDDDPYSMSEVVRRALIEGVSLGSVMASSTTRLNKKQSDLMSRQFSPEHQMLIETRRGLSDWHE